MVLFFLLAVSLSSRPLEASPSTPSSAGASDVQRAQTLLTQGRLEEAAKAFEAAVANRPDDAQPLAGLAVAYASLGDPRAESTYERAIARDPKNLPLRVAYAEYLWRLRRYDKGNVAMERVIAAAPGNPKLKAHYGVNLADQGRFAQAVEQLEGARRAGLEGADVLYYLGSALWEVGRLEDAERRLREAAARDPKKVEARHRLGRLLLFEGKPAEATAELSEASRLAPESAEIWLDLGRGLEAVGKTSQAEEAYRKALELEPGLSAAHYTLGTLLARTDRKGEAEQHIRLYGEFFQKEQERRFRAGSRQAELNLGWTELDAGRTERALEQFRRHPEDVEALRGEAAALAALGRHEDAAAALERALKIEPDNRALRWQLDREREKIKS